VTAFSHQERLDHEFQTLKRDDISVDPQATNGVQDGIPKEVAEGGARTIRYLKKQRFRQYFPCIPNCCPRWRIRDVTVCPYVESIPVLDEAFRGNLFQIAKITISPKHMCLKRSEHSLAFAHFENSTANQSLSMPTSVATHGI
jgi:hypothetical protein